MYVFLKKNISLIDVFFTLQELCIRVTEEDDPLLLYTSIITETEYSTIKKNQGLLVDFANYPYNIIDLIEKCISEQNKKDPRYT